MRVVADTGPLNYLVQIDAIDLLPKLFGTIIVPSAVRDELRHPRAPPGVRAWIVGVPSWLEVGPSAEPNNLAVSPALDEGERAAIALAANIDADLILMDDRDAVAFARVQGFAVTGTLGVLDLAAQRGLIDLVEAFTRLRGTTFHYRQGLLDALLAQRSKERK
jgi:predicted nucleic acid-binding protein